MLFEELGIQYDYTSTRHDVYNDFFNRILPHSILYKRFGGLFSGRKFVQCAEGIQDFIKENDLKFEDLHRIFVNQGPGSFSGIRTSLAIAKGISLSKNIQLYGYNTFRWACAKFYNK